jgi:CTP:phosphocholine cytidylyltransferase-like protein
MEQNKISAIIIATEITKGMKSIGPKSLLQIKKTLSVIEHQILELQKYHKDISINIGIGFEAERMVKALSKYDVNIIANKDFKTTNQVKSIVDCIAAKDIESILVINNGILFKKSFGDLHNQSHSAIYMLDKAKPDFSIGCQNSNDTTYLFYDLPEKWGECVFLNRGAITKIKDIAKTKNLSQLYVFELINMLVDAGHPFEKIKIPKNSIMKITGIKDLQRAKVFI